MPINIDTSINQEPIPNRVGSGNSYTEFANDGTLTLQNDATVWDDYMMALTQGKQGANSLPDFDYTNVGYLFPQNDASEIIYLIGQLPHTYKEGSRIYPHLHWQQKGPSAIGWFVDYKIYANGLPAPSAFTTLALSSSVWAYTSGSFAQISKSVSGIDGTDFAISTVLLFKLYRNDNTYNGDALASQFDIHFEVDSLGSRLEYIK